MWKSDGKTWQDRQREAADEHYRAMKCREKEWHQEQKERREKEAKRRFFEKESREWLAVEEKLHRPSTDPENPSDWKIYQVWMEDDPEPCRFCGNFLFKAAASSHSLDKMYGESEEKVYHLTVCPNCK